MASAVRQTEERVAEVRRRAEDAVNQVKRQALLELQRAVGAAEIKALEIAAERVCSGRDLKPTALLRTSPPSTLKTLPRAATPITATTTQTNTTPSDRLLPLTTLPLPERSLASERLINPSERLINPERLISQERTLASERILNPERTLGAERLTLASLSTAQGLIGIGKK
ncbi:putative nervy [Operophtera brumata]|uniref:Putative nervy n=1 Tax=Operophtera brumata TaxID=104452 RepID=A0A0L7KM78_OPEBR|nr:putative nervy [Operophtera brumata]